MTMIKLIVRTFIKDSENISDKTVREKYGILGGVLGIICNVVLFITKLVAGTMMNSIAVTSDAVNNLSDTGSSLITVVGSRISSKNPDREHPFGHGRAEYIAALIVSFIIEIVGFELLKSSFGKILSPEATVISPVIIGILIFSVLLKLWMFSYNRYLGKLIDSEVLKAAASDSLSDVFATSAVIVSAAVGHFTNLPIDGFAGLIVSAMIMYTGFGVARSTVDRLMGAAPDKKLVDKIEQMITESSGIIGVHDIIVHDYGPGRIMASAHAEVPENSGLVEVHDVIDSTEERIFNELGVSIVLHIDPTAAGSERYESYKTVITDIVSDTDSSYSIHDFRFCDDKSRTRLFFDLAVPCEISEKKRTDDIKTIRDKISAAFPETESVIKIDTV